MHHYERCLGFSTRGHVVSGVVAFTLAVSLITNIIFIMLHFRHGPHEGSSTTFVRVPPYWTPRVQAVALGFIERAVSPARLPHFTPPGKLHHSRRCMIKSCKAYTSRMSITVLMLFGRRSYVTQMTREGTPDYVRKEALARGKFKCAGTGGNWRSGRTAIPPVTIPNLGLRPLKEGSHLTVSSTVLVRYVRKHETCVSI